jgi:hypothetical protein
VTKTLFKGRPRKTDIHDSVMSLYEKIADGSIKSYTGLITYMKNNGSFGRISNIYKIRSSVMGNLKNIAEKEYNVHVTAESIFHTKVEEESLASLSAQICLSNTYYNKVISKNVTALEYVNKMISEELNPTEIAKVMIELGIKDKKSSEMFVEYVAKYAEVV